MLRLEKLLLGTNKKPWWESRKIIPQQASSLLQSLGGPERLLSRCNWGIFMRNAHFIGKNYPNLYLFNFAQQSKESCMAVSNLSMIIHNGEGVEVEWVANFQVVTDSKATSLPLVALFQRSRTQPGRDGETETQTLAKTHGWTWGDGFTPSATSKSGEGTTQSPAWFKNMNQWPCTKGTKELDAFIFSMLTTVMGGLKGRGSDILIYRGGSFW